MRSVTFSAEPPDRLEPRGRDNYVATDGLCLPSMMADGHRVHHPYLRTVFNGEANDGLMPVADGLAKDPSKFGWRRAADTNFNTDSGFGYHLLR